MLTQIKQLNRQNYQFNLFSGLDYLKIDIANSFGKDKLSFQERLDWFDEVIEIDVFSTMETFELLLLVQHHDPEEPELALAGLLAYRDYLNNIPSGYRIALDASASGSQCMSALTCCVTGLVNTGLIGNERADVYTVVYDEFKKVAKRNNIDISELELTRTNLKSAVMKNLYGSTKAVTDEFGSNEQVLDCYYEALHTCLTGADNLRLLLLDHKDPDTDEYVWYMPDGFTVHIPVENLNKYKVDIEGVAVTLQIKEKTPSKDKKYIKNVANLTHSVDSAVLREIARRCMFDKEHIAEVLYYLNTLPESSNEPLSLEEKEKLGKLGELIHLYELSDFCSVRIVEYIKDMYQILKLSQSHRDKLKEILTRMHQQGTFELICIHDSFCCLCKYGNFIRYWYKEIMADMVESDLLPFLVNQIKDIGLEHHVPKEHRKLVANLVRQSNYGIC